MKIRSPEIIVIEGVANEVSHTEWRAYAPAAETLKRGIDIARTAVIRMKEARTVEEWIEGRKIAQRAMKELQKSVLEADVIKLRARQAAMSGIASPDEAVAILYEHINYEGRSLALGPGYLKDMRKNIVEGKGFSDEVSSHKILPGHVVTAYEDINFGGASVNLTGNVPDYTAHPVLKDWNDVISSIRVNGPVVTPAVPIPGETLWEKIVAPAKTVATNVVDAAKASIQVIKDATNKMISKIAEMSGQAKRVRAARDATMAQMQEIRAIAPRVKDAKIRADITNLEREVATLDAKTASALKEANAKTDEASKTASEAAAVIEKGEPEEIGAIGSPGLLLVVGIAAGAATIIIILVSLVSSWGKTSANAKALAEQAKADAELAEAEKVRIEELGERRELATDESERLRDEAADLRAQANELVSAGNPEEAQRYLNEAAIKEDQAIKVIEPHLKEIEPLKLPTAVPAVAEKPTEKTALEKWTGIKPSYIGMAAIAFVLVMLAPHIIGVVKAIAPKKE